VRQEFIAWNRSPENNRAPGNTCLRACALLEHADRPWQDASQIHSKGCGANMRVAPLGLVPGLSDEQRAGAAQLQSALTHGHPTALAASDLTAHAVRLLAQGAEPAGLIGLLRTYALDNRSHYHERWLGDLWSRAQDPGPEQFIARGWDECLAILDRLQHAVGTVSPEDDPCLATGEGWIAEEALATGLLCFLLFADEPLTALRRGACTAGDSDSIACLAGAFAGAHLGAEAWPDEWADRIEYRSDLLTLGALWDA
jgi:ADP-ribosylglycohydrolase